MQMIRGVSTLALVAILGCGGPSPATEAEPGAESNPKESAPKKERGVLNKKTQDIVEFNPNAGKEVSDSKVRAETPILAPLEAYGPIVEKVAKLAVVQRNGLFYAEKGWYPKDFDEFMREIVHKKNNELWLPKLPFGHRYEYDVANHKLVVTKPGTKK